MKQQLPLEINENGTHYTLTGDYYLPDISVPDKHVSLGHYGRMRKTYLEEHRPGLYERLLLSGKLYQHLAEIDETCTRLIEHSIPVMAAAESVNERLKAADQMEWIGRMNNIHQRTEEMILRELIFE